MDTYRDWLSLEQQWQSAPPPGIRSLSPSSAGGDNPTITLPSRGAPLIDPQRRRSA